MANVNIREIVVNELLDGFDNIAAIGYAALDIAEPIDHVAGFRERIPRNENYVEEVVPLYSGDLFKQHFRMSREAFEILLNEVGNAAILPPLAVIPLQKKVLFTLWVLSKPESFLAAGDRFGIARSSAHYIFKEIVNVLNTLIPNYIRWPANHQEAIMAFEERSNGFPGIVGAIDGCHIPVKQPALNANDYYNRKQFHSIILQGICNHRMIFIDIFIGLPGRSHDARVFRQSPICRNITNINYPLLPPELHIIGDSAYPLLGNLLTPFRDNGHLNVDQINYNTKLSSVRSVIERAYGRLKGKFRRLKYLDIGNPEFGTTIIAASCVLHNFTILHDTDNMEEEFEVEDMLNLEHQQQVVEIGGLEKRVNIMQNLR